MDSSSNGESPRRRPDDLPGRRAPKETFEPYEEPRRIPLPVYWIAIALGLWGLLSLYANSQAVRVGQADRAEKLALQTETAELSGHDLFQSRCATCHQANGAGVRGAVPPLDGSAFVVSDAAVIVQILLHGIDGPIRVGEDRYAGHMPSFASVLPDAEIARLASYVRGAWSNRAAPVDEASVRAQRARFAQRTSWRGGEEIARVFDATYLLPQPPTADTTSPGADDGTAAGLLRLTRSDDRGAWACASCHGLRGEGSLSVPRLAGLPAEYISKQLLAFAEGRRHDETMSIIARELTAADRQALGRYYAALYAPSTAQPALGGNVARGQTLALHGDWERDLPPCFSCHGSSGFGVAPTFPSLAAQHPAYTAGELAGWAGGERGDSPLELMNGIARRLSNADRRAVADYLATLPPVPSGVGPSDRH
jgi:cytochrome c553